MATASVSNTPECSICCESFKTPKLIPCGHTFCLGCIKRYIVDKIKTFPCPTCQQDVKIPKGGAKMFTTNLIAQTFKPTPQVRDQPPSTTQDQLPSTTQDQPPSTTQPKCPNHKQREVDYYCNNCNVGLCSKCIFKQHKDHETLDLECDETRNEAIEKLQHSQNVIQNRIKNLAETRSTLLESFEQLKSLCKDSCAKVIDKTEQIVSVLRKSCKQIIKDIKDNLEENRIKVEDREKEITSEINLLENDMESNISPSTKTTLNILQTLPSLIEKEKLGVSRKDYNLCIQYLQWVGKDFSLDINQLGSVISKPLYIPGSYQFIFNDSYIEKDRTDYYSIFMESKVNYNTNKFRNNNLVWSCGVRKSHEDNLGIGIGLSPNDNPGLNYCIIDGQLSLVNIDDDSKTITNTVSERRLQADNFLILCHIDLSKFNDINNGYLNSNGQFVVQFDITQIREISRK